MPVKDAVMTEAAPVRTNTDPRVDELGKLLEAEAAGEWKKKQKRIEELKKSLCAAAMEGPTKPTEEVTCDGSEFVAVLHSVGEVRELRETVTLQMPDPEKPGSTKDVLVPGLKAVQLLMGDDLFYRAAGITLKNVEAYLTIDQREKVLTKREGRSRTLKAVTRRG